MLMPYRSLICATALAGALLATACPAQVVDFGKYPDLKGQWTGEGDPNNWRALAGPAPLTPNYQKRFEQITADSAAGGAGNWPARFCVPPGMPAMMNFYDPAEIIVMPQVTYILISHTDDSFRRIYTDGRPWPTDAEPTFAGYSIGNWVDEDRDGKYDVLEVETRFLKLPRAYDISGLPFHDDGETTIKERIYLDKADKNKLYDEITVLDHALTRPYVKKQVAVRSSSPKPSWHSDVCSDKNAWIKIGDEDYKLGSDGKLMPSKNDQPPPDLKYFDQATK
jgi:hypothetical protein